MFSKRYVHLAHGGTNQATPERYPVILITRFQIIENTRSWRDSWVALTSTQLGIVTEYEGLYDPIEGTGRTNARTAVGTPELQLHRTFALKEAYAELKTELTDELGQIETSIIAPATSARDCLAPIKKTIKKRDNRRLDYEKAQDKALKLQRKPGKSAKDEAALLKAQEELARATDVCTLHIAPEPAATRATNKTNRNFKL